MPTRGSSIPHSRRILRLLGSAMFCGEAADDRRFAMGVSGGRTIPGTVPELASLPIDQGMGLQIAFHQPRIDNSGNHAASGWRTERHGRAHEVG